MIETRGLTLRVGALSLADISFCIPTGGYALLMGRTGAGKTTILEAICGLTRVAEGRVLLNGQDVTGVPPSTRGVGYVPQDRALFTAMSVRDNLAFALRVRRWSRAAIQRRIAELADLLQIAHLLPRMPSKLSGGESQRVALGRALAFGPSVLLLDEPLSALDDQTRSEMYTLLRDVRAANKVTALHVTHHLEDVRQLADQFLLLENGRIKPMDSARTAEM